MSWFQIQVTVSERLKEPVMSRLFELGAEGVDESEEKLRVFFDERLRPAVTQEMKVFLGSLAEMHPALPPVSMEVTSVREENWVEKYKECYVAQKLTPTFFLKPAWDSKTVVPDGMIPIIMEPGQAFGTGLHASTNLTLKLLEHTVELFATLSSRKLLDVGTGTGILAIAASKLGIGEVVAMDNDPIAMTTAEENARRNSCPSLQFQTGELSGVSGGFDIILSNILLETHRLLATQYLRLLLPGGQLILSGLLASQRHELEELMNTAGFALDGTEGSQEWMAFIFKRCQGL